MQEGMSLPWVLRTRNPLVRRPGLIRHDRKRLVDLPVHEPWRAFAMWYSALRMYRTSTRHDWDTAGTRSRRRRVQATP